MTWWVTLRLHATGATQTTTFSSALGRGLWIIGWTRFADVVAQGER